ncbi:MAG: Hsp20/alpha crystallin family protein [Candidatus Omnitrophica bacterium]|nr:Hsp20/alpha crystallin family protein [Candidatus Omnitrophota bacterium]
MTQTYTDTQVAPASTPGEVVERKNPQILEEDYYVPPVDIYETGDKLVLLIDVPGIARENIHLTVEENLLTVVAKQESTTTHENEKWLWREHESGSYRRQFRLGEVIDTESIASELKNGVLRVSLPKIKPAQPRRVEVKTAS